MKQILILSIFTLLFSSCTAQSNSTKVLSSEEFKTQIENKNVQPVQLIDVRTPEEFHSGHIEGAINIDFYSENFLEAFNEFDKEQAIYLYCRSGNRSGKTATKLEALGFKEIYDLKGGILKYKIE